MDNWRPFARPEPPGVFFDTASAPRLGGFPMRRDSTTGPGPRAVACLALLALSTAAAGTARAQVPEPYFPRVEQRSGLMSRFAPSQPQLPHDKLRDTFYDTRWTDHPDTHPNHPNTIKDGGLYGRHWPGYCTQSFFPY